MKKLQDLTCALMASELFNEDQLDSWVERMELEPAFSDTGAGRVVGRMRYNGVIDIQNFNSDNKEHLYLFAILNQWLSTVDCDRKEYDLAEPRVLVEPTKDKLADIEIDVEFYEDIHMIESVEPTPLQIDGVYYALGEGELCVAEEIDGIQVNDRPVIDFQQVTP